MLAQRSKACLIALPSEIAREKDSAIEEVRKEFAGLAVTAAERIVERSLDAKSHSSLMTRYLKKDSTRGRTRELL
ncbi:MAG: hypothetical protein Ct9H300mP19_01190 [Dehalococcoidia bacterium]|nr:MAG: hypothetical protein Ct9H300mP19_01190 [Dehalococcoidia bacterium]